MAYYGHHDREARPDVAPADVLARLGLSPAAWGGLSREAKFTRVQAALGRSYEACGADYACRDALTQRIAGVLFVVDAYAAWAATRPDAAVAPAGQAAAPAPAPPAPATPPGTSVAPATDATAPASPPADAAGPVTTAADVRLDSRGRLAGIDGVLDQIGEALARVVRPIVRDDVIPILARDRALQREIGAAAGRAVAERLRPYALVVAGSAAVAAGAYVYYAARRAKRRAA